MISFCFSGKDAIKITVKRLKVSDFDFPAPSLTNTKLFSALLSGRVEMGQPSGENVGFSI